MTCRIVCEYFYSKICCTHNKNLPWEEKDDTQLIESIINGYTLDEIVIILNKPTDLIEYKILDILCRYPNHSYIYNEGSGPKYINYINFIKNQYSYSVL